MWIDPWGLRLESCYPKVAKPHKVINDLKGFQTKNFHFGNQQTFKLEYSGMKHILERHHPEYWNGTIKRDQTFLPKDMSINEINNAIFDILQQNRDILIKKEVLVCIRLMVYGKV